MKIAKKIPEQPQNNCEIFHLTDEDVKAIDAGVASFKAGRITSWAEVRKELRQRVKDAKENGLHHGRGK